MNLHTSYGLLQIRRYIDCLTALFRPNICQIFMEIPKSGHLNVSLNGIRRRDVLK